MTTLHPRWEEFCSRLAGPEACDFRHEDGRWVWTCEGGKNRSGAVAVLRAMALTDEDILASLDFFDTRGGYCDCEILFNVDRDAEDVEP